jgi:hypothetical protein
MSTKEYTAPLTWARVLELAAQGHDHYDAALTSTRARQLVASVREELERDEMSRNLADSRLAAVLESTANKLYTATATLERVRADNSELVTLLRRGLHVRMHANGLADWAQMAGAYLATARDAVLAGQPEAPKELDCVFMIAGNRYSVGDDGMTYALKPEAPKGQGATEEAHLLADIRLADALTATAERLAAANARIVELEEELNLRVLMCTGCDAANARAVEWEQIAEQRHRDILDLTTDNTKQRRAAEDANARIAELEDKLQMADCAEVAANARADAAERAEKEAVAALDANWVQHQRIVKAETERDQLAARVQGLVHWYSESPSRCTPEEREVLEACREMRLEEEDADDEPGEPVEVGEDCYIYTDDQHAIVRAELANRAAKAKREAK